MSGEFKRWERTALGTIDVGLDWIVGVATVLALAVIAWVLW